MAAPTTANCAVVSDVISIILDGPIISTATPKIPSATPMSFPPVIRSSDNSVPAIKIVNSGVVALMIDARPEVI